ncbi:Nitroreductase family protein [Desulfonema limicola]|uniref:Nitroreductase family protein n=1 Tax=Desulfonema limicola TaxID=45656 RepID=A0A975GFB5_9BACT|nr:nitroreductase family protein [Desulfonema limicola]QTA79020.1 Nitroreductase family protein [Desulfonema limicola]
MTDLNEIIKGRRSIRKYEEKDVSDETLTQILDAVRWSPSWTNCQCWDIVVVKDIDTKEKLRQTIAPKNPAVKAIVNAPVVLALCGKTGISGYYDNQAATKFGDWFMFDLGIAAQTLCLKAYELGLGTVIVGLLDHDRAKDVLKVPETHELAALIPLGYPAKISKAPKRKEINEFTHYENF